MAPDLVLGIPFFNTTPFSLSILGASQEILGDRLLAFQAGNEPDQYVQHEHRPEVCSQLYPIVLIVDG